MLSLFVLLLAFLVHCVVASSHIQRQLAEDQKDSPLLLNRSSFHGRKWHSSVVAGNYLYIDGGEILYEDGNNVIHTEAKSTYSIDLSISWTNSTVSMKQIDKAIDGQSLNVPNLWPALDNSSFYAYNGEKGWFFTPADAPTNKLYKFTSDGSDLARVGGSATACGPDTCYAVGGLRYSRTDNSLPDNGIPAAGIVSYNLSSGFWYNDTLVGTVFQGPWTYGKVFWTDVAGSEGILILIGGSAQNAQGANGVPVSFRNVYIYDIASKTWHEQGAGGDVPGVRTSYCTVGVRSDNNTYEIFMYGGSQSVSSLELDNVWVLSLPSFQWHQGNHSPVRGRTGIDSSCNLVGHRQMVITGGLDPDNSSAAVVDPWPLGLGVFDLNDMVFKDRYDADASAYSSPKIVKTWYTDNGPMAKDINDDVKQLFFGSTATNSSTGTSPSATGATGADKSESNNTGAIAGGVVGGVFVLAAAIAGVWLLRRRKRRNDKARNACETDGHQKYEIDGRGRPAYEVGGKHIHEKDAQQQRHELL